MTESLSITKHKFLKGSKGRVFSVETKRKISQAKMGHLTSKETREKMSLAHKGKKLSKEHRMKIVKSLLGHQISEETRRKIGDKNKGAHNGMYGRIPWNKGKKCSDKLRQKISNSVQKAMRHPLTREKYEKGLKHRKLPTGENHHFYGKHRKKIVREKISHSLKKKWEDPEFIGEYLFGKGIFESKTHYEMKTIMAKKLSQFGFRSELEKPMLVDGNRYIIDVFAVKDKDQILIECGNCDSEKLANLRKVFNRVFHIPFGTDMKEIKFD